MNQLDELLRSRRSARAFLSDPLPDETVRAVMTAGILAPTGRNSRSVRIIRVRDAALQAQIREENARIMGAPPPGRPADPFYSAPEMLMVLADAAVGTAIYDGALALGYMMLKAEELGLGACWIHRAAEEMRLPLGRTIAARAGLSGDWIGIGHLALGRRAAAKAPPREPDLARLIEI